MPIKHLCTLIITDAKSKKHPLNDETANTCSVKELIHKFHNSELQLEEKVITENKHHKNQFVIIGNPMDAIEMNELKLLEETIFTSEDKLKSEVRKIKQASNKRMNEKFELKSNIYCIPAFVRAINSNYLHPSSSHLYFLVVHLTEEQVIERLKNDWSLLNRGTGWYISPVYIPYTRQESTFVPDDVVASLVSKGILREDLPRNTAIATLISK